MRRYAMKESQTLRAYEKALSKGNARRVWAKGTFNANVFDDCKFLVDADDVRSFKDEVSLGHSHDREVIKYTGDVPEGYVTVWDSHGWTSVLPEESNSYGTRVKHNGQLARISAMLKSHQITRLYSGDSFDWNSPSGAILYADTDDVESCGAVTEYMMSEMGGDEDSPVCVPNYHSPDAEDKIVYDNGEFYNAVN